MTDRSNWLFKDLLQLEKDLEVAKSNPDGLIEELNKRIDKIKEDLHNENNKIAGIAKRMLEMIESYGPLKRKFFDLVYEAISEAESKLPSPE